MHALLATPLPLWIALSEHPSNAELVIYQLTGLAVVFTALGLIWTALEVMAFWFKRAARRAAPAAGQPAPVASGEIPPEVVAAMAAAVHTLMGGSPRITSIVQLDAPDPGWVREGRRQIHSARKVR